MTSIACSTDGVEESDNIYNPGDEKDDNDDDEGLKLEVTLPRDVASNLLSDTSMRDPFITVAEDGNYYLTYTDNANFSDEMLRIWKSSNLEDWEEIECSYRLNQVPNYNDILDKATENDDIPKIWAPEIYNFDGKWYATHTTNQQTAILAISETLDFAEFDTPFGSDFGHHHDPMIFTDEDNSHWLVWACAAVQKFNSTLTAFEGDAVTNIKADNGETSLGHEGCQIIKIEDKYVLFGTGWSDDWQTGTYNLYYTTSDRIDGGYGPRRFAGRCLGHGTIFQDNDGQWWCTAFVNGTYTEDIPANPTMSYTINKKGLTLVPINIEYIDGEVYVNALDPRYTIDTTIYAQ